MYNVCHIAKLGMSDSPNRIRTVLHCESFSQPLQIVLIVICILELIRSVPDLLVMLGVIRRIEYLFIPYLCITAIIFGLGSASVFANQLELPCGPPKFISIGGSHSHSHSRMDHVCRSDQCPQHCCCVIPKHSCARWKLFSSGHSVHVQSLSYTHIGHVRP